MKHAAIFFINIYQTYISRVIKLLIGVPASCKYPLTCSAYAKQAIRKHGIIRGGRLAFLRLLSCHPF